MTDPHDVVRPLIRTRQYRQFTPEPPTDAELDAIVDVARWSGSSHNSQPWRFIVIRSIDTLRRIADAGMPQTLPLQTATTAVAIVVPADPDRAISHAYDEGRAAERMLVAAGMLGLGGGITWVRRDPLVVVREVLGLSDTWLVRTIVAIGHPTDAARAPKAAPGTARRPRDVMVADERWPSEWAKEGPT